MTTTTVIVAWVDVPKTDARNTLDFIGLEYCPYTKNQLMAHEW